MPIYWQLFLLKYFKIFFLHVLQNSKTLGEGNGALFLIHWRTFLSDGVTGFLISYWTPFTFQIVLCYLKHKCAEVGEMSQWLGELPDLPEDPSSNLQICNSSSRISDTLFQLPSPYTSFIHIKHAQITCTHRHNI